MMKRKMFQCTEENNLVRINVASAWVAGPVVASRRQASDAHAPDRPRGAKQA